MACAEAKVDAREDRFLGARGQANEVADEQLAFGQGELHLALVDLVVEQQGVDAVVGLAGGGNGAPVGEQGVHRAHGFAYQHAGHNDHAAGDQALHGQVDAQANLQ